jgi:hypothetical protein
MVRLEPCSSYIVVVSDALTLPYWRDRICMR